MYIYMYININIHGCIHTQVYVYTYVRNQLFFLKSIEIIQIEIIQVSRCKGRRHAMSNVHEFRHMFHSYTHHADTSLYHSVYI